MKRYERILTAIAVLPAASCSSVPAAAPPPVGSCSIIGSSDWAAWVNAMPGPGAQPKLIVTGKVTMPSAGWDFIWRPRVMESYPVQVAIDLAPLIPQGGAEVVTTRELRHEMPIDPPVGSVTVRCGDRILASIAPVETAH